MNQKDIQNVHQNGQTSALGKIEDSRVFFVLKKTEKISTALFMITDVFNNSQDVLKNEIQEGSIILLKDISKLSTDQISGKESIDKIIQSFLYIKSLIDVSEKINCISENNKSILVKEINYCIERVNELKFNPLQLILNNELSRDDFFINNNRDNYQEEKSEEEEEVDSSYKDLYKRHIKDTKKTFVKKDKKVIHKDNKSNDKSLRQDKIVSILSKGGDMNIKDISSKLGGVSSKTIQRDLNEMISSGIVKKEGERRWSVYSIN
jgi:hypothetical protein